MRLLVIDKEIMGVLAAGIGKMNIVQLEEMWELGWGWGWGWGCGGWGWGWGWGCGWIKRIEFLYNLS